MAARVKGVRRQDRRGLARLGVQEQSRERLPANLNLRLRQRQHTTNFLKENMSKIMLLMKTLLTF